MIVYLFEKIQFVQSKFTLLFGLGHSEYKHNLMYYSVGGKTQKWLGIDDKKIG